MLIQNQTFTRCFNLIEATKDSWWRRWSTQKKFNLMENLLLDLMNSAAIGEVLET